MEQELIILAQKLNVSIDVIWDTLMMQVYVGTLQGIVMVAVLICAIKTAELVGGRISNENDRNEFIAYWRGIFSIASLIGMFILVLRTMTVLMNPEYLALQELLWLLK